jgi:hypothetical protein
MWEWGILPTGGEVFELLEDVVIVQVGVYQIHESACHGGVTVDVAESGTYYWCGETEELFYI